MDSDKIVSDCLPTRYAQILMLCWQMVLDAGRLAEFGSPKELLSQKKGLFYELVEKSHDKDLLYNMVKS
jgi:hypothetical protein